MRVCICFMVFFIIIIYDKFARGALGVLIPSLTTTSPLPVISDKASTSGFLVAFNKLLGGDSNEQFKQTQ